MDEHERERSMLVIQLVRGAGEIKAPGEDDKQSLFLSSSPVSLTMPQ